jgi:hypothetical protein
VTGDGRSTVALAGLMVMYTTVRLEVRFGNLKDCAAFADQQVRREFYERFEALDAFRYPEQRTEGWPSVPLSETTDLSAILSILREMAVRIREA